MLHPRRATHPVAVFLAAVGLLLLPAPGKTAEGPRSPATKPAEGPTDRARCLIVFGLDTQVLNFDGALAGWKGAKRRALECSWANCPPNGVEDFPGSDHELQRYDVLVLSDVNYKALGEVRLKRLCDYVEHGGALLVTGGPYALGNGEFQGTRFLDLLPVSLAGPFDLKWAGPGTSWPLTAGQAGHAVVKHVSFAKQPRVFWNHFVTPKQDAEVVLIAGAQPALVLGRHGKGKVAVLTLSPTGAAAAGETAWWAWDGWPPLLQNLFAWLTEKPS